MDFASLMSSEISKTKSAVPTDKDKKYITGAEAEAARVAAYKKEQEEIEIKRAKQAERKRKIEEEEENQARRRSEKKARLAEESRKRKELEEREREKAKRRKLGLPETEANEKRHDSDDVLMTDAGQPLGDADVIQKLRDLGEPARLFAESPKSRLSRYRRLLKQRERAKAESMGPIPTTLELLPEEEMRVPSKIPTTPEGRRFLFRQLASYFTLVLSEWEIALNKRSEQVKQTFQGRQALNAMAQARENLKPIFRKFEKGTLEEDIVEPIVEIVRFAQERRYVDANDGYLRLSIGKAYVASLFLRYNVILLLTVTPSAWPIGVTMVGIHERSAREKLHESGKNSAHIMSDETTRKALQSIKRCISFAQVRWPPEDLRQLMG